MEREWPTLVQPIQQRLGNSAGSGQGATMLWSMRSGYAPQRTPRLDLGMVVAQRPDDGLPGCG